MTFDPCRLGTLKKCPPNPNNTQAPDGHTMGFPTWTQSTLPGLLSLLIYSSTQQTFALCFPRMIAKHLYMGWDRGWHKISKTGSLHSEPQTMTITHSTRASARFQSTVLTNNVYELQNNPLKRIWKLLFIIPRFQMRIREWGCLGHVH